MTTSLAQSTQSRAKPARRGPYKPPRSRLHGPKGTTRWVILVLVAAFALVIVSPFLLLILNSFKTEGDYLTGGPLAWPKAFSFQAWGQYITDVDYFRVLTNSIVISGLVAVFGVVISLLAAYAIGIGKIRANAAITGILLFATMIPQEALLYPLYAGMQEVGLRNTIWSVVIIFTVLQGAFGTYLLSSLLGTFPPELLEAASLDGAGRWRILWRIIFPMMRPTISVLLVFFFIWTWNEFLLPFVMLTNPSDQIIPIALATMQGQHTTNITELNAGSLLSLIPTFIFFFIFQRTLSRGIAVGAVK